MLVQSTTDLRTANRAAILSCVAQTGAISRLDLASSTGLTVAAISRITRELIDAKILEEISTPTAVPGRGRKTHCLQISRTGIGLVSMVISANRKSIAIANCHGSIIHSRELPELKLTPPDEAIGQLCAVAEELIGIAGIPRTRLLGVSVVVAVNTNPSSNDSISSPVLQWESVPLKAQIESTLNLPVHLEARAVALLEAELWQTPANHDRSIFLVNNGWRLGSSVHVNDSLIESNSTRLGQVAHVPVSGEERECYCGNRGCLDAVASGAAIVKTLESQKPDLFDAESSLDQKLALAIEAASDNGQVAAVFYKAGQLLGEGLKSVNALFEPERILLAGATGRQTDYVDGVRKQLFDNQQSSNNVELKLSKISSLEAATRSGLDHFLLSNSLDVKRLQNGHASGLRSA